MQDVWNNSSAVLCCVQGSGPGEYGSGGCTVGRTSTAAGGK